MTKTRTERIERLAERRAELISSLAASPSGLAWCEQHSEIVDEAVRIVAEDAREANPGMSAIALVATGGYGRREMAPYSDIDITVIAPDDPSAATDSAVRALFRDLHWAFGTVMRMDVGYAYRLVADAPGLDATTLTGLMDGRLVDGSSGLFRQLNDAIWEWLDTGEFLANKIDERRAAFRKYHDTPLVVEPQLKEGAGGLRCFHCANWLLGAIGERPSRGTPAYEAVLETRNMLHFLSGKRNDLLTRSRQAELADLLGMSLQALMDRVSGAMISLHSEFERAREKLGEERFSLSRSVVALRGEARIVGDADLGDAAVGIALATRLGLRVADIPAPHSLKLGGPAALFALCAGESTLRNLDRCGLLERMLPELTTCRTLMPEDAIHVYSVFEHTCRLVQKLDNVPTDLFVHSIRLSIAYTEPLYLAALLHDVGKIDPAADHSVKGAEISEIVARRWELAPEISETVKWLIREHLTMAKFMQLRDVMNPQTVEEFAAIVGTRERLDLLTVLTWADIDSVSDEAWTPAKQNFLSELYRRTAAMLEGESTPKPDSNLHRQRLMRRLREEDVPEEAIDHFVQSLPAHYLTSSPPELVKLHLQFARKATEGETTVDLHHQQNLSGTEVTVCTRDEPGLLSKLLGILYALDIRVESIRACTTDTEPAVALDVFTVNFGGRPLPSATAHQLSVSILDVLNRKTSVADLIRSRGKDPDRRQNVYSFSFVPGSPGVLEVRAPRGRGMPYRFSRRLSELKWNIVAARVGMWAGQGAATFYILDENGGPLPKEIVEEGLKAGQLST